MENCPSFSITTQGGGAGMSGRGGGWVGSYLCSCHFINPTPAAGLEGAWTDSACHSEDADTYLALLLGWGWPSPACERGSLNLQGFCEPVVQHGLD